MRKATPEQLCSVIKDMDGLAQSAFSEIASLARLALLAMEQPATYGNGGSMDAIARVLSTIKGKAEDIDNCINSMEEGVGCNYIDDAQRRRWDASRKARESVVGGRV